MPMPGPSVETNGCIDVVESLMVPLLVIVIRVIEDRTPQMGLAQQN